MLSSDYGSSALARLSKTAHLSPFDAKTTCLAYHEYVGRSLVCTTDSELVPLSWLLQRPTVANVIVGARNESQLIENIGAVGWSLTPPSRHMR